MRLKQLVPTGRISESALLDLDEIFQGERLRKEHRYREAEEKYKIGLAKFPEGSGGRNLAYNKLGVLYEEMQDIGRAIEIYEVAAAEEAVTPFTYLRLGRLCLDAGRCRDCLDNCEKGARSLKISDTNLLEEVYFWFSFKRLRRKAKWGLLKGQR